MIDPTTLADLLLLSVTFANSGQMLLAIDQLQRAKENWFNAETLRGSVLAMLLLSSWYGHLNLPHAARYHASMALYILVRSSEIGAPAAVFGNVLGAG